MPGGKSPETEDRPLLEILIIAAVLILDQGSKLLTDRYLTPLGSSFPLWPGVFHLTSAHNRGAAWGMLQGARIFFIAMTLCVAAFLIFYLMKNRKHFSTFVRVLLALIIGGAIGNLIDRIFLGYVRDMLYFVLIDFPIFNVADSALSIGCVLLAVNVLFMKDDSLWEPGKHAPAQGDAPAREGAETDE